MGCTVVRQALAVFLGMASYAAIAAEPASPKRFDDWFIECGQGEQAKRCYATQELTAQGNDRARILKVSVGYIGPKGEPMVVVLLPLGIDLHAGAAFAIDGKDQIAFDVQQCLGDGCVGAAVLQEPTLRTLLEAKQVMVGMRPFGGGQTVAVPVSPKGLKAAMASLKL